MWTLIKAICSTMGCLITAVLFWLLVVAGYKAWIILIQFIGGEFK